MRQIKERLIEQLSLEDPGLTGCQRRNAWEPDNQSIWRGIRGNALMALVGEKDIVYTQHGNMEYFRLHDWLLQFRGGQWNSYWLEDFYDTWALIKTHGYDLSSTVIILQENKGELTVHMVPVPDSVDPAERTAAILASVGSDPPSRIQKKDARAMRVCRWCPVRVRCNAQDVLDGSSAEWSPAYQTSLR